MKEIVNFLFIIDVSGSMYGQKIAAVNASLAECIFELKRIEYSEKYDIRVSVATFAENMQLCRGNENPDHIIIPNIEVKLQADGLYLTTSFSCLYRELKYLFDSKKITDGKQGMNTFIILFSDAKPVDREDYEAAYQAIQSCMEFRNAAKYVGYAEDGSDRFNRETVRFVDYKAERIVNVSEISDEISRLQRTLFSGFNDRNDNGNYDWMFV